MFNFPAHISMHYLFQFNKAIVVVVYIHFSAYELYPICHVEDCIRHFRLDTDIPRPS